MKKKSLVLVLSLLVKVIYAQDFFISYIKKVAPMAVSEMHRTGIPASIKLAQAIVESSYGRSTLAKKANNHFAIKCRNDWKGAYFSHTDDKPKECFRKYDSILASFIDHSEFLKHPRYAPLFLLPKNHYKAWARGLKKAGYATVIDYDKRLIKIIEKYELSFFDDQVFKDLENKIDIYLINLNLIGPADVKNEEPSIFSNPENLAPKDQIKYKDPKDRIKYHQNGNLKYIVVTQNDTLEEISKNFKISIKKLIYYNDLSIDKKLEPGQNLFLRNKQPYGPFKFYEVGKEEDMYWISQKMGIKLKSLYSRNLMKIGDQPKKGDVLYLKGRKKTRGK